MAKILVLEDDPSNAEVIELVLQGLEHKPVSIQNADIMNQLVSEMMPDLIIMDILLGSSDGRDLCNQLKRNDKTKAVPVLLLTAMLESQVDLVTCKPDALMFKPFDCDTLGETVNRLIEKGRSPHQIQD